MVLILDFSWSPQVKASQASQASARLAATPRMDHWGSGASSSGSVAQWGTYPGTVTTDW